MKPSIILSIIFLSTLSLRRATGWTLNINGPMKISIHALLAESDLWVLRKVPLLGIFLSTLSLRRATDDFEPSTTRRLTFLSTLSLRRATPCITGYFFDAMISIHALLAESDRVVEPGLANKLNFYPRSPCGERHQFFRRGQNLRRISIHALLAESDGQLQQRSAQYEDFYPRSPCGERLLGGFWVLLTQIFLSTLSLRRATAKCASDERRTMTFLSTLSLRRATAQHFSTLHNIFISIHALLAESDARKPSIQVQHLLFLSTLSLRRATRGCSFRPSPQVISIHALLAESDDTSRPCKPCETISIHALLAESDGSYSSIQHTEEVFLSTLSLRRATATLQGVGAHG